MNDDNSAPVKISTGAAGVLQAKVRLWSGWPNAKLVLGATGTASPYAACFHDPAFEVRVNPETLLLNPNRVLKTVTPFRLRQEALLTGAMLHEAGHARHSHWQPSRYGNPPAEKMMHGTDHEGQAVTPLVLEFAKTLEEARVEGLIARNATAIGAHGLAWTMRCSAIRALPFTDVSMDPAQAVLDVLSSWALRAGRQISTAHHYVDTGRTYKLPAWVDEFSKLLGDVVRPQIVANKKALGIEADPQDDPWGVADPSHEPEATEVMTLLYSAVTMGEQADEPGSTVMVDVAKSILDLLFPPQDQEQMEAGSGCPEDSEEEDESDDQDSDEGESPEKGDDAGDAGSGSEDADPEDTEGESDEDGQDGEGNTEPEDTGSGTDPGAGDSGSDSSDSEDVSDQDTQAEAEARNKQAQQAKTQTRLDDVESKVSQQAAEEQVEETVNPSEGPDPTASITEDQPEEEGERQKTNGAGSEPGSGVLDPRFRQPVAEERLVKAGAERFLRNIIDPSEAGKQQITDSPAALVDGAALAAWKAGGQTAAPLFFKRIKRTEQPAPPVKIAVLVDVSFSMGSLQKPSALLSWALAAAALDLRNFAGRGVQVESTLIHWGSSARVIQRNGRTMPGIYTDPCMESTIAMSEALDLVARELPGFFDPMTTPQNRLLVQFTDWELGGYWQNTVQPRIGQAITNGVNMLSVVPQDYSWRSTCLDPILQSIAQPKGRSALLRYNPNRPTEAWTAASEVLSGADTNYGF